MRHSLCLRLGCHCSFATAIGPMNNTFSFIVFLVTLLIALTFHTQLKESYSKIGMTIIYILMGLGAGILNVTLQFMIFH
jgi:hypothetical protein